MADEIELKLAVAASAGGRLLARHPRLAAAIRLPARRLVNIYYDTPDLALRRRGVALRLRKQGRQWLQTVKCAGRESGGLSTRPEWEYPYRGDAFDFYPIDDEKLRDWLSRAKLLRHLRPVFETRFSRQTWRVATAQGVVLAMLDRGEIVAGERQEALSELELELAQGSLDDLFSLADELAQTLSLRPEPLSKADRGYRLAAGIERTPQKAGPSGVTPEQSAGEAFRAIALGCVTHLQANETGVQTSADPEFIHQMRVAIRRLRSALRLFAPVLGDAPPQALAQRLGHLAGELGAARDWDVLIGEMLHPVQEAFPDDPRVERLIASAAAQGKAARAAVRATLADPGYGRLMIEVLALLHRPPRPSVDSAAEPSLGEFAAAQLARLHRRVRKAAKRAATLDIGALHRLRIAIKRLRYGLEFFAPIYPPKTVKREVQHLTRLQDDLGVLNDIANAGPRLMLCADDDATLREAVALAGGWYGPRYRELMTRLPEDIAAVTGHRFIWEESRGANKA
jgi:inorganic triphosphatase YgiF